MDMSKLQVSWSARFLECKIGPMKMKISKGSMTVTSESIEVGWDSSLGAVEWPESIPDVLEYMPPASNDEK